MYKALKSFTTKNYDVHRTEILQDDFTTQDEIDEYLEIGYIKVYDDTLEVTENGVYDTEDYEKVDVNVESSSAVVITNGTKFAYSQFAELPEWLINADLSQLTDANQMFNYCTNLTEINLDLVDFFSNAINVGNMFYGGYVLETITFGDIDKINRSSNLINHATMFGNCFKLSDETLNLIMKLLPKLRPTSPSSLKNFGISSTQATKCQSLSNYADFIAAGWTTGY